MATMNEFWIHSLDLPVAAPFDLKLEMDGLITSSEFQVLALCRDVGESYLPTRRHGAILHVGTDRVTVAPSLISTLSW